MNQRIISFVFCVATLMFPSIASSNCSTDHCDRQYSRCLSDATEIMVVTELTQVLICAGVGVAGTPGAGAGCAWFSILINHVIEIELNNSCDVEYDDCVEETTEGDCGN